MLGESVSVLVSDANSMACQLLARALQNSDLPFNVVACATDSKEIVRAIEEYEPDVAVISAKLEDGPLAGLQALRRVRGKYPNLCSVVLLESSDGGLVVDSFRSGARGVFCRNASFEAFCKCIEKVHKGEIWATSSQLQIILNAFANAVPLPAVDYKGEKLLTKREEQVVGLVSQGLTNREISDRLNLSEHTVKNYLFRIYNKLGVSSRVELVLYGTRSSPQSSP
jgi:DNA-binding NarL/FixJ family response regulator